MALYITFAKWDFLCLHCLKEICGLVQHYAHHNLHNLWPMYGPHWRLPSVLDLRNLYLMQFHHLVIFMEWSWEMEKFCLFLFLLNHFHWNILPPGVSSFSIWLCVSWLFIKFSLNCKNSWSSKSTYGSDFILFMFTTSWTPSSCSLLWYIGGKPDNYFSSLNG